MNRRPKTGHPCNNNAASDAVYKVPGNMHVFSCLKDRGPPPSRRLRCPTLAAINVTRVSPGRRDGSESGLCSPCCLLPPVPCQVVSRLGHRLSQGFRTQIKCLHDKQDQDHATPACGSAVEPQLVPLSRRRSWAGNARKGIPHTTRAQNPTIFPSSGNKDSTWSASSGTPCVRSGGNSASRPVFVKILRALHVSRHHTREGHLRIIGGA